MKLENITKKQPTMKNTLTEMKNTVQGINSGVNEAEDEINDLKDKEAKNTHSEQGK